MYVIIKNETIVSKEVLDPPLYFMLFRQSHELGVQYCMKRPSSTGIKQKGGLMTFIKYVYKSSITGRFVSSAYAMRNPATTFRLTLNS